MIASRFLILMLLFACYPAYAEIDASRAEALVKNSPCLGQTIEAVLNNMIHIRSPRDLGWQVFNEDGQFEVERAFLINKSMPLRFRWRINADRRITPLGKRAEALCTAED